MTEGINKASNELQEQLDHIRVLRKFVQKTREQINEDQLQQTYIGTSTANQRNKLFVQQQSKNRGGHGQ